MACFHCSKRSRVPPTSRQGVMPSRGVGEWRFGRVSKGEETTRSNASASGSVIDASSPICHARPEGKLQGARVEKSAVQFVCESLRSMAPELHVEWSQGREHSGSNHEQLRVVIVREVRGGFSSEMGFVLKRWMDRIARAHSDTGYRKSWHWGGTGSCYT